MTNKLQAILATTAVLLFVAASIVFNDLWAFAGAWWAFIALVSTSGKNDLETNRNQWRELFYLVKSQNEQLRAERDSDLSKGDWWKHSSQ